MNAADSAKKNPISVNNVILMVGVKMSDILYLMIHMDMIIHTP